MRERKVTPVEIRAGSHRRLDIGWVGGGSGRGDWGERGAVEGALVSVGREGGREDPRLRDEDEMEMRGWPELQLQGQWLWWLSAGGRGEVQDEDVLWSR